MNQRKVGGENGLTCFKVSAFVFAFLFTHSKGRQDKLRVTAGLS